MDHSSLGIYISLFNHDICISKTNLGIPVPLDSYVIEVNFTFNKFKKITKALAMEHVKKRILL